MNTSWKFRSFVLFFVVLISVYLLVPTFLGLREKRVELENAGKPLPWYHHILPQDELSLGLDLQGGLYMELDVDIEEALRHQLDFLAGDIQKYLSADFEGLKTQALPGHRVRVAVKKDDQNKVQGKLQSYFGKDQLVFEKQNFEVFFDIKSSDAEQVRKNALSALKDVSGVGDVLLTNDDKSLAVSFLDDAAKQTVTAILTGADFVNDLSLVSAVSDVMYLGFSDESIQALKRETIEQSANSVRNRIDRFGVAEASVSRQGERLVVELPGVKDPDRIIDIVKRTGKLEFRLVDESKTVAELEALVSAKQQELNLAKQYQVDEVRKLNEALKTDLPQGTEIVFQLRREKDTAKVLEAVPYLLETKTGVTGDMLENASVQSQNNLPYVSMSFNKAGTKKFGDLTSANVGKQLAIVLDDVVMSSPVIKSAITGGQAQIELGFGRYDVLQKEAKELVLILKEGALPASLSVATKNVIGPSLGKESIEVGLKSIWIATIVIVVFMILYYKVGGVIANVALLINVLFIFAILCLFQASLTLPGIAGVVLTMGMAVDANVIIFERMREERHFGKNAKAIVDSSYSNAMGAILDGNITTFIAGLVLFEFGTGPIKGFATTLMIGIITTLVSAIIITRTVYDWMTDGLNVRTIRI